MYTPILSTNKSLVVKTIIHICSWGILLILPIFLFNSVERHFDREPIHYIASCMLLLPFYYLNYFLFIPKYLSQKKILKYIGIIILSLIIYLYIPEFIRNIFSNEILFLNTGDMDRVLGRLRSTTLILFLVVLTVSISVNILTVLFETQRLKKNIESEKVKAELMFLKSQVNPHFLFNTLNSIYYLTLKKSDDAPKAIIKLSDIMRYIITETNTDFVTLQQEIDYIEKYIELQKLRIPDSTSLNYEVRGDTLEKQIAPLIIIPFIENAFKYGVSPNLKTSISILIEITENIFHLKVKNNKIDNSDEVGFAEIGINNIKKRLELIYPDKHKLIIESDNDTYLVNLKIELLKN